MGRTIVATVLMTATGLPATAQPVLTAAGGIMPRYVINLVELDDPDVFCAQAGCTWNFTLNVGVSTAQVQLVAPGSAPGGGAFPMATVAAITAGSPNTPFMALDAGHLRTVGVFAEQEGRAECTCRSDAASARCISLGAVHIVVIGNDEDAGWFHAHSARHLRELGVIVDQKIVGESAAVLVEGSHDDTMLRSIHARVRPGDENLASGIDADIWVLLGIGRRLIG